MSRMIQVTNDRRPISNSGPVILRRKNGELVTFFNTMSGPILPFPTAGSGTYLAWSSDDGNTWSEKMFVLHALQGLDAIEDSQGTLVLLANIGRGLITLNSNDGRTWSDPREVTPTKMGDSTGSIIRARDGYYYVGYGCQKNILKDGAEIEMLTPCITRSKDLLDWEKPVAISSHAHEDPNTKTQLELIQSSEFNTKLIQLGDGVFYSAFISYDERGIVVVRSLDGVSWKKIHLIPASVFSGLEFKMIEWEGRMLIIYPGPGKEGAEKRDLLMSALSGEKWMEPKKIFGDVSFGADAVVLGSEAGIVFSRDDTNGRNIFFAALGL